MQLEKGQISGFGRLEQSAETALLETEPTGEMLTVFDEADRARGTDARWTAAAPHLAPSRAGEWVEVDAHAARISGGRRVRTEHDRSQNVVGER